MTMSMLQSGNFSAPTLGSFQAAISAAIPWAPLLPSWATQLLVIEPAAHMDWDWVTTFEGYYNGQYPPGFCGDQHCPASTIYPAAVQLLKQVPSYTYSACEMSYLQRHLQDYPENAAVLRGMGGRFSISGGGVTSAENLLCHGETFIRNYLVGRHWARATFGIDTVPNLWIPDDFGHDAQLPVVLRAMGYEGVAFWRIPGGDGTVGQNDLTAAAPGARLEGNIDVRWSASDGSSVRAHWLWKSYCEGNNDHADIETMVTDNKDCSAAPFRFVPIDCDFNTPSSDIVSNVDAWNANEGQGTGVYAVVAPFTAFSALIAAYESRSALPSWTGPLNPYFSGCYATRPALKQRHYAASRTLLAAEVFERVSASLSGADATQIAAIDAAWADLIPSSHHDYIVGTATDYTTNTEQMPLLNAAYAAANAALATLQSSIVGELTFDGASLAVFNPLGFDRSEVVVGPSGPFTATVPALGYATVTPAAGPSLGTVTLTPTADGWTLENQLLAAQFDANGNLTGVTDLATNLPVLAGVGNAVAFYQDSGNIYRFGNEIFGGSMIFQEVAGSPSSASVDAIGGGPLAQALVVRTTYQPAGARASVAYAMRYELRAGEPLLRITLTGCAPSGQSEDVGFSVLVRFPFSSAIAGLPHGTACHWDPGTPRRYYEDAAYDSQQERLLFEATHGFVVPEDASGTALGAVYHQATPAWGIDASGALVGCVLRNAFGSTGNAVGGQGEDTGVYEIAYALRVPSGLGAATTGQPLREALAFQSPLVAMPIPSTASGRWPPRTSLASTSPNALILAAKRAVDGAGTVLRLYQPAPNGGTVSVALQGKLLAAAGTARAITALELAGDPDVSVSSDATGLSVETSFALSTVVVG